MIIIIYHINCGVTQGFPALRKAVTTYFFTCVDIANQLLSRHSSLRHSVRLMNERQYKLFVGAFSNYGGENTKKSVSQTGSNFPRRGRKPNKVNPKVAYSVALVLAFLSAENENRQLEDLQLADFGRLPERLLLLVKTKSINENFVT